MDFGILNWLGVIIPVVVLGIMAIVFVPFIIRLVRNSAQNSQLMATGLDASATIVNVWETGVRINQQPQVGILLEVHPANAAPFQAQATTVISYFQAAQFQPGATVQVKYDPNNTSKVAIAALGGAANPAFGSAGAMNPAQSAQVQQLIQIDAANQSLRATGEAAQATITNVVNLGVNVNGNNPALRFQLEVHPTGRPTFAAQAVGVVAETSIPKYQSGSSVWVKFDPNDISRVTLDHS